MAVSIVASLRPLAGQCMRRATTGLLSVQIRSPTANMRLRAVVGPVSSQTRYQSTSGGNPKDKKLPPKQQQVTLRQFAGRALVAGFRNLGTALSPSGLKRAYGQAPGTITMAVAALLLTFGVSFFALRSFYKTFYSAEFNRYPEPIANTLRRAIYYTNIKPEPELALKFYKKALQQCAEVGLDPFSDEVLGIRIQIAFWLQKIGSYKASVKILGMLLSDCQKWVDVMELSVKDGKVDESGHYISDKTAIATKPDGKALQAPSDTGKPEDGTAVDKEEEEAKMETLWRKRQRLLAKAIGTSVKLGELYSDEHVLEPEKSQKHLIWAVETALKEFQRRKTDGIKPGEEAWLTPQELGGAMESLGRDYERKSEFHLAIPLFFQALRVCDDPCHRVTIMNNLAASFAQFPIYAGNAEDVPKALEGLMDSNIPKTRKECLEAAENWARNAYTHAKDAKGETRTEECDEACAVALCNWGDVASMLGKKTVARKRYNEGLDLSNKLGFAAGASQAKEGLLKLNTETPK